uniref:G-protein coupled receptors family 1 profile domain-containing protein n=1 Tax=Eptatretus burgeri TaxID=7764 RepID=A0A8C4QIC9_EPTBU
MFVSLACKEKVIMSVFMFIMCISIPLNAAIIAACFYHRLHSPMLLYIALSSLADTSWEIVVISCYFSRIIAARKIISFNECLFQLFSIHCSMFQQFLTTWLMYVDRHWAIFWPYSYMALMVNKGGAVKLVMIVLTIGLLLSVSLVIVPTTMVYCNYSVIVRDVLPVFFHQLQGQLYLVYGLTGFTALYSTWCIVRKCHKSSTEANIKALHTCFTQLFASTAQFISLIVILVLKRFFRIPTFDFILVLISSVSPAIVNPLIFGFRMQEIRSTVISAFRKLQAIHHKRTLNLCVMIERTKMNIKSTVATKQKRSFQNAVKCLY